MTKAEIVSNISNQLGIDKSDVQITIEKFMEEIKDSLEGGNNVYLRGFGSFIIKKRAKKTGRNISKNTAVIIPEHNIPAFKPSKVFVNAVKSKVTLQKYLICQVEKKERDTRQQLTKEKKEEELIDIKRNSARNT